MKRSLLHHSLSLLSACALLFPSPAFAQQPSQPAPKKFELTVDSIMRGTDLVGYEPTRVYWSQDSRRVYFLWKRAGESRLKEPDLYVANRDGGGLRKLSEEEAKQAPPAAGDLSKDKTMTVFAEDGDIFIYDHVKNQRRQITNTTDGENSPRFTTDQKYIVFTRQNNLYRMALDGAGMTQLTDIRAGGAPTEAAAPQRGLGGGGQRQQRGATGAGPTPQQRGTESQEYVKNEERELLEAVRERAQNREEQENKRKQREKRKPFMPPAGQSVAGMQLSPDGKYVLATVIQPPSGAKNAVVPNYVTESAYTEEIPSRNKVGDEQNRTRLAIFTVETGDVSWVDHGQKQPQPEQRQAPPPSQSSESRGQTQRAQERERNVQLLNPQWSEDGKNAVTLARSADNKDRWTLLIDPASGKTKILDHQHDDAWVGGPGAFTLGWLGDNKTVYFESERDGWSHLYSVSIDGGEPKQLTSGRFEVSDVRLSEDKTKFYFTSSEGDLGQRHLYTMPVTGGERARITTEPGNNQSTISPDETALAIVRSYSNRPPE
ncbi:MAG TPA: DPP IV N-terminal domain-containing protein, partial [Blastocatellia bacterium]